MCIRDSPSYNRQILKSNRADAQSEITKLAGALERLYASKYTYIGAAGGTADAGSPDPDVYANSVVPADGVGNSVKYELTLSNLSENSYTITATAANSQVKDATCDPLTLRNTGVKGPVDCW